MKKPNKLVKVGQLIRMILSHLMEQIMQFSFPFIITMVMRVNILQING